MNSFGDNVQAIKVWFDEDSMWVSLKDGRILSVPKVWFPAFEGAAPDELSDYQMLGGGIGIHWEKLDEDISVPNLLKGYGAVSGSRSKTHSSVTD